MDFKIFGLLFSVINSIQSSLLLFIVIINAVVLLDEYVENFSGLFSETLDLNLKFYSWFLVNQSKFPFPKRSAYTKFKGLDQSRTLKET